MFRMPVVGGRRIVYGCPGIVEILVVSPSAKSAPVETSSSMTPMLPVATSEIVVMIALLMIVCVASHRRVGDIVCLSRWVLLCSGEGN